MKVKHNRHKGLPHLSSALLSLTLGCSFGQTAFAYKDLESLHITSTPESIQLALDLSDEVKYKVSTLENPDRVVIDLKDAKYKVSNNADINNTGINRIRHSQHKGNLRLVLDVQEKLKPSDITLTPNSIHGNRLALNLERKTKQITVAENTAATQPVVAEQPAVVKRHHHHHVAKKSDEKNTTVHHKRHHPVREYVSGPVYAPRLCPQELKLTPFYSIVNQNSPLSTAKNELCLKNMLSFSSLINADLRYTDREGDYVTLFRGEGSFWGVGSRPMFGAESKGLYGNLKNASLFIDAKPNDWLGANLSLAYVGASSEERTFADNALDVSTVYQPYSALKVDEAIITIANPEITPFYIRLGKQYLNSFGDYKPYPITQSLTQLLTQSRTGALTGGAVFQNGFYGSASWSMARATLPRLFITDNANASFTEVVNQQPEHNYSAKIGYIKDCADYGFNMNLSYLHDIRDVDYFMGLYDVIDYINVRPASVPLTANQVYLFSRAPAIAFHLDGHWKQFGYGFETANALRNMNIQPGASSSKIFAWGVNANYSFPLFICDLPSIIDVGYQHAGNANVVYSFFNSQGITPTQLFLEGLIRSPAALGGAGVPGFSFPLQFSNILPENRIVGTFTVDIWPELFSISFQWVHDFDFSEDEGGTGRGADIATARMSLQF